MGKKREGRREGASETKERANGHVNDGDSILFSALYCSIDTSLII